VAAGVAARDFAATPNAGGPDLPSAAGGAGDADGDGSEGSRMTVDAGGKPLASGFGKRGVWPPAAAAHNMAMDM
jgi:hypothetical protein